MIVCDFRPLNSNSFERLLSINCMWSTFRLIYCLRIIPLFKTVMLIYLFYIIGLDWIGLDWINVNSNYSTKLLEKASENNVNSGFLVSSIDVYLIDSV